MHAQKILRNPLSIENLCANCVLSNFLPIKTLAMVVGIELSYILISYIYLDETSFIDKSMFSDINK